MSSSSGQKHYTSLFRQIAQKHHQQQIVKAQALEAESQQMSNASEKIWNQSISIFLSQMNLNQQQVTKLKARSQQLLLSEGQDLKWQQCGLSTCQNSLSEQSINMAREKWKQWAYLEYNASLKKKQATKIKKQAQAYLQKVLADSSSSQENDQTLVQYYKKNIFDS